MSTQKGSRAVMEEVTRSNLKLSMPSRNISVLREQALAAWHFQPSKHQDTDAVYWIFEASQRDMETIRRALERELNSTPDDHGLIIRTSKEENAGPSTSEVTSSSSVSSCDPCSPSQAAPEVSDSMTRGNRSPPAKALSRFRNNQRSIPVRNNFVGKRRSRRGNRAPIVIMRADPNGSADDGVSHESSNRTAPPDHQQQHSLRAAHAPFFVRGAPICVLEGEVGVNEDCDVRAESCHSP